MPGGAHYEPPRRLVKAGQPSARYVTPSPLPVAFFEMVRSNLAATEMTR